jgi:alpha-tubulin suppressor-like RCC1 family protein
MSGRRATVVTSRVFVSAVLAAASLCATGASAQSSVVYVWGANFDGQLGNGTTTDSYSPIAVQGLSEVASVAGGGFHSMVRLTDGTVRAWGYNYYGELGNGMYGALADRYSPVVVTELSGVTSIAGGYWHSLALLTDGTVQAWGYNYCGQLGDGTATNHQSPQTVPGLSGVTSVTAGFEHSLALLSDGTVQAWGLNRYGELGDGTTTWRYAPVAVTGLSGVSVLAAGVEHTLARLSDGTVRAWGDNSYGQLGDGTTTQRNSPITVPGLSGVVSVAGGRFHSLALLSDGTVQAWGYNASGQLGDNTQAGSRPSPVAVTGLTNIVDIEAAYDSSFALSADGQLWAWGYNLHGSLGVGDTTNRLTPKLIAPPLAGYKFASIAHGVDGMFMLATLVPASSGPQCGSADFNCDGDVGTDADIEAFFACLSGTCPSAPCTGSADFNGDGDVGTDADIEAFFRVLGGGNC